MSILSKVAASVLAAGAAIIGNKARNHRNQGSEEQRPGDVVGDEALIGRHARMVGWLHDFGHYDLISLDKGKTWWSVSNGGTTLTPADPELIAALRGWKALSTYVSAHGTINPGNLDASAVKVLANAGLLVQHDHGAL